MTKPNNQKENIGTTYRDYAEFVNNNTNEKLTAVKYAIDDRLSYLGVSINNNTLSNLDNLTEKDSNTLIECMNAAKGACEYASKNTDEAQEDREAPTPLNKLEETAKKTYASFGYRVIGKKLHDLSVYIKSLSTTEKILLCFLPIAPVVLLPFALGTFAKKPTDAETAPAPKTPTPFFYNTVSKNVKSVAMMGFCIPPLPLIGAGIGLFVGAKKAKTGAAVNSAMVELSNSLTN